MYQFHPDVPGAIKAAANLYHCLAPPNRRLPFPAPRVVSSSSSRKGPGGGVEGARGGERWVEGGSSVVFAELTSDYQP